MHARIIAIEDGDTLSVPYLVLATSRQLAIAQAKRRMQSAIETVVAQAEQPLELRDHDVTRALEQGRWWAELDSEIVTVMGLEPQRIDTIQ